MTLKSDAIFKGKLTGDLKIDSWLNFHVSNRKSGNLYLMGLF